MTTQDDSKPVSDVEVRLLLTLTEAAVTWWRGKKPRGWSVEKHVANPLVNCVGYREKLLARRASRWFALCKGIKQ